MHDIISSKSWHWHRRALCAAHSSVAGVRVSVGAWCGAGDRTNRRGRAVLHE